MRVPLREGKETNIEVYFLPKIYTWSAALELYRHEDQRNFEVTLPSLQTSGDPDDDQLAVWVGGGPPAESPRHGDDDLAWVFPELAAP